MMRLAAGIACLTLTCSLLAHAAPKRPASVWANISVSRPVFVEGQTQDLWLHLTLVNDGSKPVIADLDSSEIVVNGTQRFLAGRYGSGAGPQPLASGEAASLSNQYNTGPLTKPGVYRVVWVGKNFRSPEVVFRVLPRRNPAPAHGAGAAYNRQVKTDRPAWDYRALDLDEIAALGTPSGSGGPSTRQALLQFGLNELGSQGWELSHGSGTTLYFKRPRMYQPKAWARR